MLQNIFGMGDGYFEIDEYSTGTREITKVISMSQAYSSVRRTL